MQLIEAELSWLTNVGHPGDDSLGSESVTCCVLPPLSKHQLYGPQLRAMTAGLFGPQLRAMTSLIWLGAL